MQGIFIAPFCLYTSSPRQKGAMNLRPPYDLARTQDLRELLLGGVHRPVNVSTKDSVLEHSSPRTVTIVNQLILMDTIHCFPDAHLVSNKDIARIELTILIASQVCTYGNTAI